ncbi:hypothetical protein DSM112329_01101 [Paraconexibacter sp. AEG42_29]|uniref:Uncharacterized protein n=1 Tax=Paraconexibacter sp. AEG42_29 TaxID=2997339 RepID=A0AAU7ASC2_9ACTN
MNPPKNPADDGPAHEGVLARDTPPHIDPDDPKPEISDEALDTETLGEGGPAGA